jgi:microcystin-dependent protein
MSSEPYVGEIKLFAGNFAILGHAFCDGSLQSIADNTALFSLIGTIYGGDGQNTFALPDLRGRVPIHFGQSLGTTNKVIGEKAGSENVTLVSSQIPAHNHTLLASSSGGHVTNPANNFWAAQPSLLQYESTANGATMKTSSLAPTGGNQPHENIQPYLVINYLISLYGVYPSRD